MSTPISTSHRSQFDGLDRSCCHQMWSPAKIGKRTLSIRSDMTIFQFGNQFTFISFSTITKHFQCIRLCYIRTNHGFLLCDQFSHFSFNSRQISLFNNSLSRVNIIIETIFNSRTYTKLYSRIEFLQRFCQQVRTRMPESVLPLFIFPFIKYYRSIFFNRTT